MLSASGEDEGADDAELLAGWIETWIRARKPPPSLKEVVWRGPYRLRNKARRDAAIAFLTARHWARQETHDSKTVLTLNPRLEWEESAERRVPRPRRSKKAPPPATSATSAT